MISEWSILYSQKWKPAISTLLLILKKRIPVDCLDTWVCYLRRCRPPWAHLNVCEVRVKDRCGHNYGTSPPIGIWSSSMFPFNNDFSVFRILVHAPLLIQLCIQKTQNYSSSIGCSLGKLNIRHSYLSWITFLDMYLITGDFSMESNPLFASINVGQLPHLIYCVTPSFN